MRRWLLSRQEDYTHGYRWRSIAHRSCRGSGDGAVVIAITSGFIRHCERCSAPYDWRRSTSRSLRMTYCNSLCEAADLGGTIESLLLVRRRQEAVAFGPDAALSSAALDDLWSVPTCPRCDSSVQLDAYGARACPHCGVRIVAEESYPPAPQPTFSAIRYRSYL